MTGRTKTLQPSMILTEEKKKQRSMALKSQREKLPAFDRKVIFAEVDASNRRFEDYTKEQRQKFASEARAVRLGVYEASRPRH